VTLEFESLTIEISVPANRDFVGSLKVWSEWGRVVAGPFPIAARASDEIAAEHGNPRRITTLPYGDPPAGTYRYGRKAATGHGSRLRQDLFGTKDVIVLLPTGGPAALGDANGRFEILIHGGPPAPNGGLRATSGHFRISDPDLDVLGDIVERAGRVTCVCVETAVAGRAVVAGLGPARQATARPDRLRRRPKPLVPYEALVAFGEYTSPDPVTDTSLNSPALGPAGQQGLAQLGMLTISQTMQDSANLATATDINAYTGGPANFDLAADNPFTSWLTPFYPSGQSPFYPSGQNVNSFNGPPGATPAAGSPPQPGSANLLSALAPGVTPGSVAASLPFTSLPSASLTSPGTASPFGNGPNPFMPGLVASVESANAWASASASAAALPYIRQAGEYSFSPGLLELYKPLTFSDFLREVTSYASIENLLGVPPVITVLGSILNNVTTSMDPAGPPSLEDILSPLREVSDLAMRELYTVGSVIADRAAEFYAWYDNFFDWSGHRLAWSVSNFCCG
jgi:hypothetical protein